MHPFITVFSKQSLKEIQPDPHPVYNTYKSIGLKLTRLIIGLSHLNEHRFNHNSESCVKPLCACSLKAGTTTFFSCTAITLTLTDLHCLMSFVKLI